MCKGTDKAAGKDLSSHILGRHTDKETINKVLTPPTEYEDKVFVPAVASISSYWPDYKKKHFVTASTRN